MTASILLDVLATNEPMVHGSGWSSDPMAISGCPNIEEAKEKPWEGSEKYLGFLQARDPIQEGGALATVARTSLRQAHGR